MTPKTVNAVKASVASVGWVRAKPVTQRIRGIKVGLRVVSKTRLWRDALTQPTTLARANLDADKRSLTMRVAALGVRFALLDREPARRARREGHFRHRAGYDLHFYVIAVQVQSDRPVCGPAQLHGI